LSTADCTSGQTATDSWSYYSAGKRVATVLTDNNFLNNTALGTQLAEDTQTFTAGAAGIVHKKFTVTGNTATSVSSMTINEDKVIKIVRNGF
jgi:hypothetical protein